jgi:hypothetical protein
MKTLAHADARGRVFLASRAATSRVLARSDATGRVHLTQAGIERSFAQPAEPQHAPRYLSDTQFATLLQRFDSIYGAR